MIDNIKITMPPPKTYLLRNDIVRWLEYHSPKYLYLIIDQAIERRSALDTGIKFDDYMMRFCKLREHIKKYPLQISTSTNITLMENKCGWLKRTLEYINLNHKERLFLTILYLKQGKKGEQRLYEIFKRQLNYDVNTTKKNIEGFKKRGKSAGVSCERLITERLCTEYDCDYYGKTTTWG